MWLIVGLGNPGGKYALTRHNIGFMAIDYHLKGLGSPALKSQFKAEICQTKIGDQPVIFCKPQTYMNLSGEAVQALMGFYKISLDHLIVIHDEIDQIFGQMKIQKNRGHGGHNGIRSISGLLGSADYIRLRLGVGRPENPNIPVADYVLNNFNSTELNELPNFLNRSCDAVESILAEGLQKASTKFNS